VESGFGSSHQLSEDHISSRRCVDPRAPGATEQEAKFGLNFSENQVVIANKGLTRLNTREIQNHIENKGLNVLISSRFSSFQVVFGLKIKHLLDSFNLIQDEIKLCRAESRARYRKDGLKDKTPSTLHR